MPRSVLRQLAPTIVLFNQYNILSFYPLLLPRGYYLFITKNDFYHSLYCRVLLQSRKRNPEFGSPWLLRGLRRHLQADSFIFLFHSLQTQGELMA